MNWHRLLIEELERIAPEKLYALDDAAFEVASTLLPPGTVHRYAPDATPETPANLALSIDALDGLDSRQARALLAHVRVFMAPSILSAVDCHCALDRLAFLALGFDALGVDESENVALYSYDLNTYKRVPDWLNARYWAHPERWEP